MSTPMSRPGPDDPAGPPPGQGGPPSYGQGDPGQGAAGEGAPGQGAPGQGAPGYGPPTPGYGPPAPGYGPPAPGYGQPAPGYGQPPPSYGQGYGQPSYPNAPAGYGEAPTQRPGQVTAAAIIGIVIGALNLLGIFSIGLAFDISVITGIFTLIGVALGAAMLAGGIQVLRDGPAQLLLMAAYTAIGLSLLSIVVNLVQGNEFAGLGLISLIIPGLIVVFIRQNGAWFSRTTH